MGEPESRESGGPTRRARALAFALLAALLPAPVATAAALDHDRDGIADSADNCPRVANPGQQNTDALPAGDACQCGDVDVDGDVDVADVSALRRSLDAHAAPGFVAARCGSAGPPGCDAADGVAARRWLAGLASGVPQLCAAAGLELDPDPNDDGVVNALDGSIVGFCVGVDPAADCDCREADVDRDGDVDTNDLQIVSAYFNQSGFPQSPPDPGDAPSVTFVAPPEGALLAQSPVEVRLQVSDAGAAVSVNGVAAAPQAGVFVALVPLVEGPNTLVGRAQGAACEPGTATRAVALDTLAPAVLITSPADGAETTDAAVPVTGTVSDPAARVRVNGVDALVTGTTWRIDAFALAFGDNPLLATATDAAGNAASDAAGVRRLPRLEAIELTPVATRLSQAGATQQLALLGRYNDGSSADLTASPQTAYAGSNAFVATVAAGGVVTAVSNGAVAVTATHLGLTDQAVVTVEIGVVLESLEVTPPASILRAAGAAQPLVTRGRYSDGSTRELTLAASGTTYLSSDPAIATVSEDGLVMAVSPGQVVVTARNEALADVASVRVVISTGRGFLRGETFDDSVGLPLGGATATLLADGSGPLAAPPSVVADARGEYLLAGGPGDAVVRISRSGFTSVERRGEIFGDTALELLDARLTPLDARPNPIDAALGGTARNSGGTAELSVAPGSLAQNATLVLTEISNQGLQGRLPAGWSPVAALDVSPPGLAFGQPAQARLGNAARFAAGSAVAAARYDAQAHAWIALPPGRVDATGVSIALLLGASGQVALLAPDAAPFTPPAPVAGEPLAGVPEVAVPASALAERAVLPPSAPAGIGARAVGVLALVGATPFPSGSAVEASVTEQFDLFDLSTIRPQPFDQDLLVYARPRVTETAERGTRFPITPSRDFSLVELAIGMVKMGVDPRGTRAGGQVIGAAGGSASEAGGARLDVPAGALAADGIAVLRERGASGLEVPLESGLDLVAAVEVDLVGAVLGAAGVLSLPFPAGLPAGAQVLVVRRFRDLDGIARLELVGVARAAGGRLVSDGPLPGATPAGVRRGGEYLFVRPLDPLGFVTGSVRAPGGASAQADALVRADGGPFAALTGADGAYLVATAAGTPGAISAFHAPSRNATSAQAQVAAGELATLVLELGVVAPFVVQTTPANGARDVLRNAPIAVRFSEPIDAASVTEQALVLAAGGAPVAGARTLSPDGLELRFVVDGGLASATAYTLAATSALRDRAGNPLQPFAAISWTTQDTSKPPQPAAGVITAALPDEGGFTLVTATQGTAEPGSGATLTNPRTRETLTLLAEPNGAFRMRLAALLGDVLALTFRDAQRREVQLEITQFEDPDGTAGIGAAGGTLRGPAGERARILPRALRAPGAFRLEGVANPAELPALPASLQYLDLFELSIAGAEFQTLAVLELSESQGRFAPARARAEPFAASGTLVVPANFLINGLLRFAARVEDADGNARTVEAATQVVGSGAQSDLLESGFGAQFPTLFVSAPEQVLPNAQLSVRAEAPAARLELEVPEPAGLAPDRDLLLVRVGEVGGADALFVVDQLERVARGGTRWLVTSGRAFPGATRPGTYAVLASSEPLVFVTGRATGPAAAVAVTGSPLAVETAGPNASFAVPVIAGAAYELRFLDPADGAARGTQSGVAPASGTLDVGEPLGPATGVLEVSANPDTGARLEIDGEIVWRFSQPLDPRSAHPSSLVVVDARGTRVFGRLALSADASEVRFRPLRRFRLGERYRWTVGREVLGLSGARLATPVAGEFTTFQPAPLAAVAIAGARDVAVADGLAIVGGSAGTTVLDVSRPDQPRALAEVAAAGGASGVAIVPDAAFVDRTGTARMAPLGLAVTGDAASDGRLDILDLSVPDAPSLLGRAQLTLPAGGAPVAGVPERAGTPSAVVVGPGLRALVAVRGLGVEAVEIVQAVPPDPVNPGRALGPRYPAPGFESVSHLGFLRERLLAAGAGGLTVLDASTLARVGGASTTGDAAGVGAIATFRIDRDGDGRFEAPGEIADLAVVANGTDGTVQVFDLLDPAAPRLVSVVRVPHAARGIALDADQRLAYVACGVAGVVVVDLDGPPSIQPIDLDVDGRDDRVLGSVAGSGAAERMALDLARGVAFVADGEAGMTVLQLRPPRTVFARVRRDPVLAAAGDEELLGDGGRVFLSDDAVRVDLEAAIPPRAALSLVIDELVPAAAARALRFPGGATAAALVQGQNALSLALAAGETAARRASLRVEDDLGATIARFDLLLAPAGTVGLTLEALQVSPQPAAIPFEQSSLQLSVGGRFSDGRVRNLTRAASGTSYLVADSQVASVSADGLVGAVAGGTTPLRVANAGTSAETSVEIQHPPALVALRFERTFVTLDRADQQLPLRLVGVFSNGESGDATAAFGTTFESSAPAVVGVSSQGVLSAQADGVARVTARNGALAAEATVVVEIRPAPNVTGIDLVAFPGPVSTDDAEALAVATLAGSGALEGIAVRFSHAGGATTGFTDFAGRAVALLRGLAAPGSVAVTASVEEPPGTAWSDVETLVVVAGAADSEPNDDVASAPALRIARPLRGQVGGAGDAQDVFRLQARTAGALELELRFDPATVLSGVRVIVLAADGSELGRFTPTAALARFSQPIAGGAAFVRLESAAGPASYTLSTGIAAAPVVIDSVSPASAGPGALVTLRGSGFSLEPSDVSVAFGGISAAIVSSALDELVVRVPANGVDGPLDVSVRSRAARVPFFATGRPGPAQVGAVRASDPAMIRRDPVTGGSLVVNRLLVHLDPAATAAQAQAVAQGVGAEIVGFLPVHNAYQLELDTTTVAALAVAQAQLQASPLVRYAARELLGSYTEIPINLRDSPRLMRDPRTGKTAPARFAYDQIRTFEAIKVIREHPSFPDASAFRPFTVAVIDSGFAPRIPAEFEDSSGQPVVTLIDSTPGGTTQTLPPAPVAYADLDGHGTLVTGAISAVNNPVSNSLEMSGVLGSLFDPAETPFRTLVYTNRAPGGLPSLTASLAALDDIRLRTLAGPEADRVALVNLSWRFIGNPYRGLAGQPQFIGVNRAEGQALLDRIAAMQSDTLAVAGAGNESVSVSQAFPQAFSDLVPNLLVVGGVASANLDSTGEQRDFRAVFSGDRRSAVGFAGGLDLLGDVAYPQGDLCEGEDPTNPNPADPNLVSSGSNCGNLVAIAAPAEDVFTTTRDCVPPAVASPSTPTQCGPGDDLSGYRPAGGTSLAAPLVTGAAAVVLAISTGPTAPSPEDLSRLLRETGDDVGSKWVQSDRIFSRGFLPRVNLLHAALAVLEPPTEQPVYVSDQEADNEPAYPAAAGWPTGRVVALSLDPMSCARPLGALDAEIRLFRVGEFHVGRPTSLAVSPLGDELWVVVESFDPGVGDGLAVVSTLDQRAKAFVPLTDAGGRPNKLATGKPGLAFSRDGRLLYVANNRDIAIVNVPDRKLVERFEDMPAPFRDGILNATVAVPLRARKGALEARAFAPFANPSDPSRAAQPQYYSDLKVSPDGRVLYALLETGLGSGDQPGQVIPIDVDLYRDIRADTPGLQSDLGTYFQPVTLAAGQTALRVEGPSVSTRGFTTGDEPKEMAIASDLIETPPNPEYLYLVHGGLNYALGVTPDLAAFNGLIASTIVEVSGFGVIGQASYLAQLPSALQAVLNGGRTMINAPGLVAAFVPGGVGPFHAFPSSTTYAWGFRPPPVAPDDVYVRRPYAIAVNQRGNAGLVGFFQTGNFGLLHTSTQQGFANPDAQPPFASLDPSLFHGFVAMTQTPRLDNHVWPSRGTFRSVRSLGRPTTPEEFPIALSALRNFPSPDERRLFTNDVEISQNGHCAYASHAGVGAPRELELEIGDFENDVIEVRAPLQELGFVIQGSSATDPAGNSHSPGDFAPVWRGGGALSQIDFRRLGAQAAAGIADPTVYIDAFGNVVERFNVAPLCGEFRTVYDATTGREQLACDDNAITEVFDYLAAGAGGATTRALHRPKGVAIQPQLVVEMPRFGDHVTDTDAVELRWRDPRVAGFSITLRDADQVDAAGKWTASGGLFFEPLSAQERGQRSLKRIWRDLSSGQDHLRAGHRYRMYVQLHAGVDPGSETIGEATLFVRFEATQAPPPIVRRLVSIQVSPAAAEIRVRETQQYTAIGTYSDGSSADVTNLVTWTSSRPQFATIAPGGRAVGRGTGTTEIRASRDGVTSNAAQLRVHGVQSVLVTPAVANVLFGFGQQFAARAFFTDGTSEDVTGSAQWASSAPGIVSVDAAGLATGLVSGQAQISAELDGIASNDALVTVTPPAASVAINEIVEQPLRDWNQSSASSCPPPPGTCTPPFTTFPGSDPNSVSAADQWIELANLGQAQDLAGWTLRYDGPMGAVSVPLGSRTLAFGAHLVVAPIPEMSTSAVVRLHDATGSVRDVVDVGALRASRGTPTAPCDEALARVPDGTGAFARDAATIGIANTSAPRVLVSLAVTPSPASIDVNATQQLVATATYSDATSRVLTGSVTWSVFPELHARVRSDGLAQSLIAGAATVTASAGCNVAGSAPLSITATAPALRINEIVDEPRRDWNDSAGGNGVACDGTPGTGAVDATDRCIELLNAGNPLDLTGWSVVIAPAAGAPSVLPLPGGVLATGALVVLAPGAALTPTASVSVVDPSGAVVDAVDVGALRGSHGAALPPFVDALARTPHGLDTGSTSDFRRKTATPGAPNAAF